MQSPGSPLPLDSLLQISQLKDELAKAKDWSRPGMRMVYSGTMLKDDQTVEGVGIKPNGLIICMLKKVGIAVGWSAVSNLPLPSVVADGQLFLATAMHSLTCAGWRSGR